MMQRQRAREDISRQQMLHIAKEAKLELASANRAAAMSKTAHSEELILLKRERDDARENYETLVSTTNAAAAAAATKGNAPGDKVLQEENTRLTLALRSETSLLAKKTSEFERMQSLLKSRSNHSASQLSEAASTILSLEEEKKKGNKRIAKLEKELTEAKEKAEEMEEMYLAVAFADIGKGEEDVKAEDEEEEEGEEGEEEDGSGEQPPTSWLLEQVVAMSKKEGSKAGAPGAYKSGSSDDEEEDSENDEDDKNEEDDEDDEDGEDRKNEEEEEAKRIHDENEDLFKDMMGSP